MIGRTNAGGSGSGGAIKPENAILLVTVPTGSTVTAVKGSISLTPTMWVTAADASLDCALFIVEEKNFDVENDWVVTATLGEDSASDTVLIDSNKEYEIELYYKYKLFWDGYISTYPDTAWKIYNNVYGKLAVKDNAIKFEGTSYDYGEQNISLKEVFSLYGYSTLYCYAMGIGAQSDRSIRMVVHNSNTEFTYARNNAATQEFTFDSVPRVYSIDVTNLNESYYLGFGGCGSATIYRFWLTE